MICSHQNPQMHFSRIIITVFIYSTDVIIDAVYAFDFQARSAKRRCHCYGSHFVTTQWSDSSFMRRSHQIHPNRLKAVHSFIIVIVIIVFL